MPVLCCPAVSVPEHIITLEETKKLASRFHSDHPQLPLIQRLITNTQIKKRHLVQSIDETLKHPGFEARNLIYIREAKARVPGVVKKALENSQLSVEDINAIIYVSCTGFMMPSLTAWMINHLGFRNDTLQLPIAQLGCAAINRAHDFCSLCYQPTDISVGTLLSNGLFGDAIAAAIVRSKGTIGINLLSNSSRLVLGTEDWISYAIKATGFHFCLDSRVPKTMQQLAPELNSVVSSFGWNTAALDFYMIHAGGPRILDDLSVFLNVSPEKFSYSRATLQEYGNIASAFILDTVRRLFEAGYVHNNASGIIAGFGPGITAEITLGTWKAG